MAEAAKILLPSIEIVMRLPYRKPTTGLQHFFNSLYSIRTLWAWVISATAVPFAAQMISLTALVELLASILAFQYFRYSPASTINRVIGVSLLVLLITSFLYVAALSEFTFEVPYGTPAGIKGFVCSEIGATLYPRKCPWLGRSELKLIEWSAEQLWVSWSITIVRITLIVLWLLSFLALSLLLAAFVVHQSAKDHASNTATRR